MTSTEDGGKYAKVAVKLGDELFRFETLTQWVNKAKSWFGTSGFRQHQWVCIDAAGRICVSGREFMRADEEGTYPIVVYLIDNDQLPCGDAKIKYSDRYKRWERT